ncbi:MAG: hypothetical protein NUV47_01410 [Patescibacteria group bacterium]|nr:hypothetical protein [Patescibacteria group bacterium]
MIYFLYGEDKDKTRAKANDLINVLQKKKPDAGFFKMTDENYSNSNLDEYIGGQGLFSSKYIVFLDNVFKNKEAKDDVIKKIKEIGKSENIFIILEEKIDKITFAKMEKNAEKMQTFAGVEKEKQANYNIFAMTNALGNRDRKKLWLFYLEAVSHDIASEEISGILFWKIKDMIMKRDTRKYSLEELQKLSSKIVSMYHEAHRGNLDFTIALEKFVLGI